MVMILLFSICIAQGLLAGVDLHAHPATAVTLPKPLTISDRRTVLMLALHRSRIGDRYRRYSSIACILIYAQEFDEKLVHILRYCGHDICGISAVRSDRTEFPSSGGTGRVRKVSII